MDNQERNYNMLYDRVIDKLTYEQLANKYGTTKERAREVLATLLRRIRIVDLRDHGKVKREIERNEVKDKYILNKTKIIMQKAQEIIKKIEE